MLSQFILSKVEEIAKDLNGEIECLCYTKTYFPGQVKELRNNLEDFRSCWKAIKAGHDVRGMLSILSARIERTKDSMKMKKKVGDLINYIDNYDEFKGEELANIPWDSIKLW